VARPEEASTAYESAGTRRKVLRFSVFGLLVLLLLVGASNFFLIGTPIKEALASDSRNERYRLVGHYRYYVDRSTLVLDLRRANAAAPADLFRGLFQCAQAMYEADRTFSWIVLARSRSAVFVMSGEAFYELGTTYALGENPVFLIRTLPEKLHHPDGSRAYGTWSGGLLGVALRQMEDANAAAALWARGR